MYLEKVFGLAGKIALVTGGGRGIGQIISIGLAEAGAKIAIFSRSGADETVKMIEDKGGEAESFLVDVTEENQVDIVLQQIVGSYGSIDILFNNAGITSHQSVFDTTPVDFRNVVDVNLTGEYIMARAVGKLMKEKNIEGSIINMASMSGHIVNIPQNQSAYNISKAAIIHMTRSLAVEWAEYGIRVNSLSPGYIGTPMSADVPTELKDAWMSLIPMHRMGAPEELLPAVFYLASPVSKYTTGSDIVVDGGYICQ